MADALTSQAADLRTTVIHQFLHGYSDGHRLIAGSLKLPTDVARLMLRMSDLSGSSVVEGFDQYITGYPLDAINAYALAMTWYAGEMRRPGCVWTHTIALSVDVLATISSLSSLVKLFRRPVKHFAKSDYAETISFEPNCEQIGPFGEDIRPLLKGQLGTIFSAYYGAGHLEPVVLVARDSDEFSGAIFALWSQQWPRLRQRFLFCTGSLSSRNLDGRAFDIQCSPPTAARDVAREATTQLSRIEPILVYSQNNLPSPALDAAIEDAILPNGASFRSFLWASVDEGSGRGDVSHFARIYDAVKTSQGVDSVIRAVAESFPKPDEATRLKQLLFGANQVNFVGESFRDQDILFALATTSDTEIFDPETLSIDCRVTSLCANRPDEARSLLRRLFGTSVNDFGEEILSALIIHMDTDTAREITQEHPKFLPGLFRARPDLARSPELWKLGGDRKRELFEAVAGRNEPNSADIQGMIGALLDSDSEAFLRRSVTLWGRDAVFSVLDWVEAHDGRMSRTCRDALDNQPDLVMDWIQQRSATSSASRVAVAHVVAPYASRISRRDSEVWLGTFRNVQGTASDAEKDYLATFLLALAFCDAPPAPLDLVAESYQRVHQAAWEERLSDEAWSIAEPFVPELSWWNNWDKCERLNRGLVAAFIRHRWPSSGLRRIKNYYPRDSATDLRQQILESAKEVKGGKDIVRGIERDW